MIITGQNAGIKLQTSAGADIPNDQYRDDDYSQNAIMRGFQNKYFNLTVRCGPTGIYNCHGLTFASRRAWLYDDKFLPKILNDDSYVCVNESEVLPGDIILYIRDNGEIDHSGIVVEVPTDGLIRVPRICSKWGHNAEFLHWANATPYGGNWQYWRVRR